MPGLIQQTENKQMMCRLSTTKPVRFATTNKTTDIDEFNPFRPTVSDFAKP